MNFRLGLFAAFLAAASGGSVHADPQKLSEQDYFSDLPEVLTVTRLAQPLSETPGAVTVIDRATIRRSGARELADVLRLVPGYFVAGWNGANPNAVYHTPLDDYGTRNLVLIDGRPVYSTAFVGDTHRSMMGILLDDIERVEVLRGSNAAAYGANAMFGVINIITRHSADTQGAMAMATGGEGGTRDAGARIGWGNAAASFRLSAGRRADRGYLNVYDDKLAEQLHFRGDLRPSADQELLLAAGVAQLSAGEGFAGQPGNPPHAIHWQDQYVHGQWRRQLSATEELRVAASYDVEQIRDRVRYPPLPAVMLDFGARGRRLNLELQHSIGIAAELRAVWGLGYKHEDVLSRPLFATDDRLAFHEKRLFGNIEWRPHPQWLVNAGGFWGDHSQVGSYFVPRLMANFHVVPDHTLRIGTTDALRVPTFFELKGDVRYYLDGMLIGRTTAARGNARPEEMQAQELGYFGNFRAWRLTLDVRVFRERMRDRIAGEGYDLPVALPATGTHVEDYINNTGLKLRGLEYQLRWKPLADTEIWLNQTFVKQVWDDGWDDRIPPRHATTLALFQKLPLNLDLGLIYHRIGGMTWRSDEDWLPPRRRLDVRLAYPFQVGSTRAEAAVVVQAANGNSPEFLPTENFAVERRAFATLRLEY